MPAAAEAAAAAAAAAPALLAAEGVQSSESTATQAPAADTGQASGQCPDLACCSCHSD